MSFDQNDDDSESPRLNNNSRRGFMTGSAGALGGPALGGALTSSAAADEHGSEREEDGHNVTVGLPENSFADSQTEIPGFPEAFK